MRILIDTHILIWYLNGDNTLPSNLLAIIENEQNQIIVSTISLWEITIKISSGKLELTKTLAEIEKYLAGKELQLLHIGFDALIKLKDLPYYHRDPFDRLLIAQAISENLTIISADRHFEAYLVEVIW
ncbi:MAG TPA: type II toxin-antitoxin system VapC family toxin [Mucilaginibacter sp.]|jgi:PIN domain nuclease of toxin-antitoxin system